jgi:hypothetical protein
MNMSFNDANKGISSIIERSRRALQSLMTLFKVSRPTITQIIPNPPLFLTERPLKFTNGPNNQFKIDVPRGFITDLASIPRALWWWQAPHESSMAPAIIHDFLYWQQPCSKDEADAVMYSALLQVGMSKIDAKGIYFGIRTPFAQTSWDNNRIARENGEKRFFSGGFTDKLVTGDIDPRVTLRDIQEEAAVLDGTYSPVFPIEEIRRACAEALREYQEA